MSGWHRRLRQSVRPMIGAGVLWTGMFCVFGPDVSADETKPPTLGGYPPGTVIVPAPATPLTPPSEASRRSAAVALNYSRASFHRIRRNPSLRVLQEEQEKILNHLNLNGIADPEIVKLYSSVLDEIAQIQLADKERELLRYKHRQSLQQSLSFNALALSAQMVTAQYAAAVRTGASSWWDYRNFSSNRDLDVHKIDKERASKIVEKSARYLDVSWKLARDQQIPDRWLVRGDDLDRLEEALREPDAAVRLRVLKRMEPFLEYYPPYWYYVARTQQAAGQLYAATETYERMANIGEGHFRKDEMLAAGLANCALIQTYLARPEAPATAERALAHSTDVWEANLICANVLQKHHKLEAAEDAILRNLDVDLETAQSRVALVSMYLDTDQRTKLAEQLLNPSSVKELPVGLLANCAARLGESQTPPIVVSVLEYTLQAVPRYNLGRDDVVIQAGPNWQLPTARITLQLDDKTYVQPRITTQRDSVAAAFEGIAEFGTFGGQPDARELRLTLEYPNSPPVRLRLQLAGSDGAEGDTTSTLTAQRRYPVYRVTNLDHGNARLSLVAGVVRPLSSPNGGETAGRPSRTAPIATFTTLKPVLDGNETELPAIELPFKSSASE